MVGVGEGAGWACGVVVTVGLRTAPRRFEVCAAPAAHNNKIRTRGPILDFIARTHRLKIIGELNLEHKQKCGAALVKQRHALFAMLVEHSVIANDTSTPAFNRSSNR